MVLWRCYGAQAKDTHAAYTLRMPSEVQEFMSRLVLWGSSAANGWHRHLSAQQQAGQQQQAAVKQ